MANPCVMFTSSLCNQALLVLHYAEIRFNLREASSSAGGISLNFPPIRVGRFCYIREMEGKARSSDPSRTNPFWNPRFKYVQQALKVHLRLRLVANRGTLRCRKVI